MNEIFLNAVVIGNGTSRKGINLDKIKVPTFGCNRIVDEFHPTYVVAIDEKMIEYLRTTDYPQHRILTPPEQSRWEPPHLHGEKVRSNAGANALIEAANRGHNRIWLLGFDFLLQDDQAKIDNVYKGKEGYFEITPIEASRRLGYLQFLVKHFRDILFQPVFTVDKLSMVRKVDAPNLIYTSREDFLKAVST